MIGKKLPILSDENGNKMLQKLSKLAESYTPEWKYDFTDPDALSTVALLFTNMIAETDKKYKNVIDKNRIQYLNLFDGINKEPLQTAKSFVVFETSAGIDEPVYIPKATQMNAGEDKYGQSRIFETDSDFTAVDTEIQSIFTTQKKNDKIVELFNNEDQNIKNCNITAFDLSGENKSQHIFLASYKNLFLELSTLKLKVKVKTSTKKKLTMLTDKLVSTKVKWAFLSDGEYTYFDKVEKVEDGCIVLSIDKFTPIANEDTGMYTIALMTNGTLTPVDWSSFAIEFEEKEILPNNVICSNLSQNITHFKPFGSPLEIFSECIIDCKKAFYRKGATVNISFDLDISTIQQTVEVPEQEIDYKVIMKKPPRDSKMKSYDVRCDYVVWEYYSVEGWKRLLPDEIGGELFNGLKKGKQEISFICPDDISYTDEEMTSGCIRIRLMRSDNLYKMPAVQYVPVINNMLISYTYKDNLQFPDDAVTVNNFETLDITADIKSNKQTTLFYNKEHEKTAFYIGFDKSPTGTPISIFFDINNSVDIPISFYVECFCENEYIPLKVIDNTNGFLNSGTMMLIVPPKLKPQVLFGKELYWIRFINNSSVTKSYNLPTIKGIYMNTIKVVNNDSHLDYFYVSDADEEQEFKLSFVNLITADVYVNEITIDNSKDNWVLWSRSEYQGEGGKTYSIDYKSGTIKFEKYAFSGINTDIADETVKVIYKTYSGTDGNVKPNEISALNTSIKYISNVYNPFAAYGGIDGYTEKTAIASTSSLLRTRRRAVTEQDYFDVISQASYGVKSIKCSVGTDLSGNPDDNVITIAVLMEEYNKGSHIFSAVKEDIRDALLTCSNTAPMGKKLILSQPHFIKLSVRVWLEIEKLENSFDLQKSTLANINNFINPLTGGFNDDGWKIGVLPSKEQLTAYLKVKNKNISISKMVMTAEFKGKEYTINNEVYAAINNPFAMAVNGEHTVYVAVK